MGKRSRDASLSPLNDQPSTELTRPSAEAEDLRTTKLRIQDKSAMSADKQVMQCSLPPHSVSLGFTTMEDFEVHYAKEHTNRCVECGKNQPSAHFLALHIDENHNPLREVLAAKGEKTYACFLPDCDRRCSTPQKRRMHMIDKHQYPKAYNFRIVDYGIDNTNSLLYERRRRRVSVADGQGSPHYQRAGSMSKPVDHSRPDGNEPIVSATPTVPSDSKLGLESDVSHSTAQTMSKSQPMLDEMRNLETSFAALQFVPRSVLSNPQTKQS